MPFADLRNCRMHYERTGSGTPVVLITGLAGNTSFWTKAIPMLSDGHDVVTVDNRGAGATEYSGQFTIADMSEDVAELIRTLGIGPAHVLGWSMGSHIALHLAAEHPELVRSLSLVSSYNYRPNRSAYILNLMGKWLSEDMISEEAVGAVFNVLLRTEGFFDSAAENNREIHSARFDSKTGMMEQMRAVDGYEPGEDARRISVPTLSVHGLDDIMTPPHCGDELADAIGGCRRLRVPGEGHVMRPESYIPEFRSFIGSLD